MPDFEDVDWDSASVSSTRPLGVLPSFSLLYLETGREHNTTYHPSSGIVCLHINGLVEVLDSIILSPILCVLELAPSGVYVELASTEEATVSSIPFNHPTRPDQAETQRERG